MLYDRSINNQRRNANETNTASSIGDFSMDGGVGELLNNSIVNSNALYSDDGIEVSEGDQESIEKLKGMNVNSLDSYDEDRIVRYDNKDNFGVYKEGVVCIFERIVGSGPSGTYENEFVKENYGANIQSGENYENVHYEIVLKNCNGDLDILKPGDIFGYNTAIRPNLKRLLPRTVIGRAVYVRSILGDVYVGVDGNVELTDAFDYVKTDTDVENVSNGSEDGENTEDVDILINDLV